MEARGWRPGCAAAVFVIGAWFAVGGAARADVSDTFSPARGQQVMNTHEAGNGGASAERAVEDDTPATPQPPCPIQVPGGVICYGPVFPELPPGNGPRRTVYLPVIYW